MTPPAGVQTPSVSTAVMPRLEYAGIVILCLFVTALQLSVAASAWLLTAALCVWIGVLTSRRERVDAPPFFLPLVAYALATLVSVITSLDPLTSLVDAKEILLFLVVPIVYRLGRGSHASILATVIISVGAGTAAYGLVQYGILQFDTLGQRPQGSMGHYMTFSGLLMLVLCLAGARVLWRGADRVWAGLVIPALVAALAVTLTRSAWVGAGTGVGLLLVLKNRKLLVTVPVIAGLLIALAPASVAERVYSTFDLQDPTNRDRFAMARAGAGMIRDHPFTGVGPDMVQVTYPAYRDVGGVNAVNPHLHNVPLQIAAERGLPALALWLWFVIATMRELAARFRDDESRGLAAAGLAAMAAMIAAGMFEYNFGDSEFLMLFLVLVTLPSAAVRHA
jgi:O-antigen ligase